MSKGNNGWVNNALEVLEKKDGSGFRIQVKKDITLKAGQNILLQDYTDYMNVLVDKGVVSEDEARDKLAKRHFVKYTGTVAPLENDKADF